jgi:hypothetical protein
MKRVMTPKTLKLVMDAFQQLFIVGTLGSLFVFVPLHARLSAPESAMAYAQDRYPVALESSAGDGQSVAWLEPEWVKSQQGAKLGGKP